MGGSAGIGFFGLLTIVLIVLKLLGKIDLSWLWVLSPLLVGVAFYTLIWIFIIVLALILS